MVPAPCGETSLSTLPRGSGEQLGGDAAAEQSAPRREPDRVVAALHQAAGHEARERLPVDDALDPAERERLVEPEPQHEPLDHARVDVELLVVARWRLPRPRRRHVAGQGGKVPATEAPQRGDGPDPDAEIVMPAPDSQVVPCAELAL